jgi:hypothetical protein
VETKGGITEARSSEKNLTTIYVCSIFSKALKTPQFFVVKNTLKINVII